MTGTRIDFGPWPWNQVDIAALYALEEGPSTGYRIHGQISLDVYPSTVYKSLDGLQAQGLVVGQTDGKLAIADSGRSLLRSIESVEYISVYNRISNDENPPPSGGGEVSPGSMNIIMDNGTISKLVGGDRTAKGSLREVQVGSLDAHILKSYLLKPQ